MSEIRLADPLFLILLAAIPLMALLHRFRKDPGPPALSFPSLLTVRQAAGRGSIWHRLLAPSLRILVIALAVLALARPQSGLRSEEVKTEGIDILLVLDISSSMLAEDIEPNRVAAAKQVAAEFVGKRVNDRIGLVIFSARAYTQCPLTLDYGILLSLFESVEVGMIEDGTAIGTGIGTAVNRLKESGSASKVVILLTDGRNNRGEIDPLTAAQLAQTFGVKIYTIGAGAHGLAPYPVDDPLFGRRYAQVEVDIDEEMLEEIAEMTGGRYFRATDRSRLEEIYDEIDLLEKTEIQVTEFTRYSELFHYPLGLALGLLCLEIVVSNTLYRRFP